MTRLAQAHDAVNVAQGFPDFPAPVEMKEAAVAAVRDDVNQYAVTWGAPPLCDAIARSYARRGRDDIDADREVTVACGATEAITAAFLALVEEGSEVLAFEPLHESYAPAAHLAGATLRPVPLRPPAWEFDRDELRRAVSLRTRALVLTHPHNPTGCVFRADELEAIAALCREHDLLVFTDEIHERIVYEGEHRFLARLPDMAQRTVVPGSALFLSPGAGRDLVRFAFPKRSETLDLAAGRLAAAASRLGVAPLSVFAQRHTSPMP